MNVFARAQFIEIRSVKKYLSPNFPSKERQNARKNASFNVYLPENYPVRVYAGKICEARLNVACKTFWRQDILFRWW